MRTWEGSPHDGISALPGGGRDQSPRLPCLCCMRHKVAAVCTAEEGPRQAPCLLAFAPGPPSLQNCKSVRTKTVTNDLLSSINKLQGKKCWEGNLLQGFQDIV